MNKPKMIVFDYGQTLGHEERFDGLKGTRAVLDQCVENPNRVSAEEVQALAEELNNETGRFDPKSRHLVLFEIHEHLFQNYLYEYFGMRRIVSPLEMEMVFWDAASPARATPHIAEFLSYLNDNRIRSAVISNISFSGQALESRINALLPGHQFEFIMASSEYVFRKPHKRIFEMAARKAELPPGEIWYCGDNGICDVDGSKTAGYFPIWYKGAIQEARFIPQNECLVVGDWLELMACLEKN